MPLGQWQRATLDKYVTSMLATTETRIRIFIEARRLYTRELGSGMAITITMFEKDERQYGDWIANCQHDHTAVDKGKEIARYLVDAGCPKDRIRVQRKRQ